MFVSWEMPWLCKGEMIKRLLIAHVKAQREWDKLIIVAK
jgi:hypothetical protein